MTTKRDYYEILGVARGAGDKEIKKAFRALAREIHPDVNSADPHAEAKFKEAAEAYEVLSNPDSRATYDQYGHEGLKRGSYHDFSQFSFEDIVRNFFGEGIFGGDIFGMGGRGPARGADIAATVEISLREAASGINREIEYEAVDFCRPCEGTGAAAGTSREACPACQGSGQVRMVSQTILGQFMRTAPCRQCRGAGSTVKTPCQECGGQGRVITDKKIEVDIPPGIATGQSIRISGAGSVGEVGGSTGDLFIQVSVAADPELARDGNDLIHHLSLPMTDAALGANFKIPMLEGEEEITIKDGTQPGEVIVLRGRGMPHLRGRARGDLKIIVDVMVPRQLTDEQRDTLNHFAGSLSEKQYHRDSSIFEKIRAAFR